MACRFESIVSTVENGVCEFCENSTCDESCAAFNKVCHECRKTPAQCECVSCSKCGLCMYCPEGCKCTHGRCNECNGCVECGFCVCVTRSNNTCDNYVKYDHPRCYDCGNCTVCGECVCGTCSNCTTLTRCDAHACSISTCSHRRCDRCMKHCCNDKGQCKCFKCQKVECDCKYVCCKCKTTLQVGVTCSCIQ
jgi:hypothetical protein